MKLFLLTLVTLTLTISFAIAAFPDTPPDYKKWAKAPYNAYYKNQEELVKYPLVHGYTNERTEAWLKNIRDYMQRKNRKDWVEEIDYLHIYYKQITGAYNSLQVCNALENFLAKSKYNIAPKLQALRILGDLNWESFHNYEKAFNYYMDIREILKEVSDKEFDRKAEYLMTIGNRYYFFEDYKNAIQCQQEVLKCTTFTMGPYPLRMALNTLGLTYLNEGKNGEAMKYFHAILDTNRFPDSLNHTEEWHGISYGNIGSVYYSQHAYDKAMPYLLKDYTTAIKYQDWRLSCFSGIKKADILLERHLPQSAKSYMDEVAKNIIRSDQSPLLRYFYPLLTKYYLQVGDGEKAMQYVDSTKMAFDNYGRDKNNQMISTLEEKRLLSSFTEKSLRQRQRSYVTYIIMISIIGILACIVLIVIQVNNKKEYKLKLNKLRLQHTQNTLTNAREELDNLTQKLAKTSDLLYIIKNQSDDKSKELRLQLEKTSLITDEAWQRFKDKMNIVYNNFVEKFEDKYRDLSPAEIRYLMLVKLGLNSKDIALALGISAGTMRVTWFRIRQKLHIDKGIKPIDFIQHPEEIIPNPCPITSTPQN